MPAVYRYTISITVLFAFLNGAFAANYPEGRVIVRFADVKTEGQAKAALDSTLFDVEETLVAELGLFLVGTRADMTTKEAIARLNQMDSVVYAQADHFVTRRSVPNDPKLAEQWGLEKVAAQQAWDVGTGGKDYMGRDLVVAVVDGGVDVNHDDLKANIWVNTHEIAGNGIDDDNNGYIDDINGWNAYDNDGDIPADRHGTHVAGIIGAQGNNELQVVGVNWNVKIMAVAGASGTTSTVLKAYGYVLKQKKLFIESNGERGANVVSTNSSFGVDYADCENGDYPAWNDIYNQMGEAGILSAAATANINLDIDASGDVPTGCGSDYLVTVTNTTSADRKSSFAGYGATTIDLGAPGTDILATLPGNTVGKLTGTSMATPHVAGAVALLHSVASHSFFTMVQSSPGDASVALKQVMLASVDPIADLQGKTVSGGRLNLAKAGLAIAAHAGEACFR